MREKKRIVFLTISTFFLFSLLIAQYFKIQILEYENWVKMALSQHEFVVKEPFQRGAFYSNTTLKKGHPEKEQPLVFDVTKFHLFVDPMSIPQGKRKEVASKLFILSKTPVTEKEQFFKAFEKKSRSRKLAMWLSKAEKMAILDFWVPYARKNKIPANAVFFATDYLRSYPFGKLLGQVLHTIREIKEEKTQEGMPTGGLEAYFNDYLKGKQGVRKLLRSPLNSLEIDKVIEPPENGADIYLTINHYIQAIAEEELEKGVKRAKAKGGWALMMDPYTGEILALAQYPFFDPSRYKEFFNDPQKIEDAKVRAVTDAFELGSIMKPITIAISLMASEELKKQNKVPLVTPVEKVNTTRSLYPGRASKPLIDKNPHKSLNMYMAIQKSSNVYMAQVIDRVVSTMGNNWYRKALVDTFGFGTKTGLELPGEATGLVPTPGKMHPNGALEWSVPTPYSLSMGHNILATGTQMARCFALFANGGLFVEPTLIRKIVRTKANGEEEVLVDNTLEERKKQFKQVLSKEVAKEIRKAMKYTTKQGGTAVLAEISGYTEAGKTGTAEKIVAGSYSKKRHVSSFIGFAPASLEDDHAARFVLLVTIDDPEYQVLEGGVKTHMGGWCAAPVFREIGRRTLQYLGVTPDDPFGYPPQDPRFDPEKADWIKEVRELKATYEEWNKVK